ncbi:MAG TPA: hypothetical protein VH589_16600 [Trebonia sp.]
MSSYAELAAVLGRIAELVSRDDADTGWSTYEVGELRSEVRSFLGKAEARLSLSEAEYKHLRLLFGPTGPLQETSIASGWASEFVLLATRFDDAF